MTAPRIARAEPPPEPTVDPATGSPGESDPLHRHRLLDLVGAAEADVRAARAEADKLAKKASTAVSESTNAQLRLEAAKERLRERRQQLIEAMGMTVRQR